MKIAWFWAKVPEKMTPEQTAAWRACLPAYKTQGDGGKTQDTVLLAHALLQYAIKRETGLCPKAEDWGQTDKGKPFLTPWPQIKTSLSHSGALAVCAVADVPVGVDVQREKQISPALIERVCTPEEKQWLYAQNEKRDALFAQLWARKESYVKAQGPGLAAGMKSVSVCEKNKGTGVFTDFRPMPCYAACLYAPQPVAPPVYIDLSKEIL